MAYGHIFRELKGRSKDELIDRYNDGSKIKKKNRLVIDELNHQENAEYQEAIEDLAQTMKMLTCMVVVLTLLNLILFSINIVISIF